MLRPVLETLLACAITLVGSLVVGLAILRICGTQGFTWLAGPVGLAALMVVASSALHVPGRSMTVGVLLAVGFVVAVIVIRRTGGLQLPWYEALTLLAPFAIAFIPFLVYRATGIFGVGIDNDMTSHLTLADAFRSQAVMDVQGVSESYPLGPHALVAAIAEPLGFGTVATFAGFTLAGPVLLVMAAFAALRDATRLGTLLVALTVGTTYLMASYYAQGSFKEVIMAALIIGAAVPLLPGRLAATRLKWVPLGLLLAGAVAVYSYNGVLWSGLVILGWLAVMAGGEIVRGGGVRARVSAVIRTEAVPVALAITAFAVVSVPQIPRVYAYLVDTGGGTSIEGSPIGNLIARLPIWEAFGIWDSVDYRVPLADPLTGGVWTGLLLAAALAGAVWWIRRGDWVISLLAIVMVVVWVYLDRWQTPYLAAKGAALAAPVLALVMVGPVAQRDGWLARGRSRRPAIALAVVVLAFTAVSSSVGSLRNANFGPDDHAVQLRSFAKTIAREPVVFLGNDDFLKWILPVANVRAPFKAAVPDLPPPPEKGLEFGEPLDVDDVSAADLNAASYLITPRDPAGSAIPAEFQALQTTRDFTLYRRSGEVKPRRLLAEGKDAYAILNCRSRAGRATLRAGGLAAVRQPQVAIGSFPIRSGRTGTVMLPLPRGNWALSAEYTSGMPFEVRIHGGTTRTMSANLDRPGPRYLAGRVKVDRLTNVPIDVAVKGGRFTSTAEPLVVTTLIATREGRPVLMPVAKACGKPVDYIVGAGAGAQVQG